MIHRLLIEPSYLSSPKQQQLSLLALSLSSSDDGEGASASTTNDNDDGISPPSSLMPFPVELIEEDDDDISSGNGGCSAFSTTSSTRTNSATTMIVEAAAIPRLSTPPLQPPYRCWYQWQEMQLETEDDRLRGVNIERGGEENRVCLQFRNRRERK